MEYINNRQIDRAFNKREEELKKEMYHLGFEDALNKKEYGSSLGKEEEENTLKDLGMEQMKLF